MITSVVINIVIAPVRLGLITHLLVDKNAPPSLTYRFGGSLRMWLTGSIGSFTIGWENSWATRFLAVPPDTTSIGVSGVQAPVTCSFRPCPPLGPPGWGLQNPSKIQASLLPPLLNT